MTTMVSSVRPVGDLLRVWRQRRRMSQLDLALEAEISQKHLSFVESGRSAPTTWRSGWSCPCASATRC
jgi:DNA-binding XRE family transcriptional regulator